MALDPSFRSRLREVLQQSAAGRRPKNPAGDQAADGADDGVGNGCACPEPGRRDAGPEDAKARNVELQYETEEERRHRVDAEQSAWIADALGGWWGREPGGVCLVVDRVYAADRVHGDSEIGGYAETLSRYRGSLLGFGSPAPSVPAPTLFGDLDAPLAAGDEEAGISDIGLRTSDDDHRFLFFDLETTGLNGGAGTCAFLIGYGWFAGDSFRTRQYFLSGFAHEAAMLRMAAEPLGWPATTGLKAGSTHDAELEPFPASGVPQDLALLTQDRGPVRRVTLATFNGKTFDVPLIGGRYLFHRLACPFDGVPHVDLLHPARRLWRHRPANDRFIDRERRDAFARYFRMTRSPRDDCRTTGDGRGRFDVSASAAGCALVDLEHAVLGFKRADDVAGAEIPPRYFHYVRTGDARPLAPVLEHNRLDLVSLAAVASVVARMLEEGPQAARNAHECLALGRLYERSGAAERATACYERAVDGDGAVAWRGDGAVEREALRHLAVRHRREHRYEEAAAAWQRLFDLSSGAAIDVEALHALAVHHEHRSKNLQAAQALVMRALELTWDRRTAEALRCRLARIERKISTGK